MCALETYSSGVADKRMIFCCRAHCAEDLLTEGIRWSLADVLAALLSDLIAEIHKKREKEVRVSFFWMYACHACRIALS